MNAPTAAIGSPEKRETPLGPSESAVAEKEIDGTYSVREPPRGPNVFPAPAKLGDIGRLRPRIEVLGSVTDYGSSSSRSQADV